MRKLILVFILFFVVCPAGAKEIAGVSIDDQITAADGTVLHLNGAGIRKKMWIKVYIAQLYLENTSSDAAQVLADEGKKRVVMYFLYDKVGKDKLVSAWNDGFSANNDATGLAPLQARIDTFNSLFDEDAVKNDVIIFDYLPGKGTSVTIKGKLRGTIEGKDFNDALLSIWLGTKPVGSDLRKAMLQQ